MIKIIGQYGYCYGVENAITKLLEAGGKYSPLFLSHPLIHNVSANEALMKLTNAKLLQNKEDLKEEGAIVFSAHGHTIEQEKEYQDKTHLIDAVCPLIKQRYQLLQNHQCDNVTFLFLGKPTHQETLGFLSHFPFLTLLDSTKPLEDQIENLSLKNKIFLVPQTTIGLNTLNKAISLLEKKGVVEHLDICPIYKRRCEEVLDFLKENDTLNAVVIVAGDPSSSNAKEIHQAVKLNYPNIPVYIALKKEQLDLKLLFNKDIYLTSATSVSKKEVENLERELKSLFDVI